MALMIDLPKRKMYKLMRINERDIEVFDEVFISSSGLEWSSKVYSESDDAFAQHQHSFILPTVLSDSFLTQPTADTPSYPSANLTDYSSDGLYETQMHYTYGDQNVLIRSQIRAVNDTSLSLSFIMTDYAGFYHELWQSISFNSTAYRQMIYYDGDLVQEIYPSKEDGIVFETLELATGLSMSQMFDINNNNIRWETDITEYQLELKFKLNTYSKTVSLSLVDDLFEDDFVSDALDLVSELGFSG